MSDLASIAAEGGLLRLSKGTAPARPGSSQKDEESNPFKSVDVVEPPYKFKSLIDLLEVNNTYFKSVEFYAKNIVSGGWEILPYDDDLAKKQKTQKEELENFLLNCNPEATFEELIERLYIDKRSTACGALEVAREGIGAGRAAGKPSQLFHVPIATLRVLQGVKPDKDGIVFRTGQRFAQIEDVSQKKVAYFNRYQPDKALRIPDEGYNAAANAPAVTNELMWFVSPNPKSRHYGLPQVVTIIEDILTGKLARAYNLNEFENGMLQKFALIVEDGNISEKSLQALTSYMNEVMTSGKPSAIPVLTTKAKGKIRKEQLTAEMKEMSWQKLFEFLREEVAINQGVPLGLLGVQNASYKNTAIEDERKFYEKEIIPEQTRIAARFTKMFAKDFGYDNWYLHLKSPNVKDVDAESVRNERETKMGVISINDIRRGKGLEPVPGGDELLVETNLGLIPVKDLPSLSLDMVASKQAENVSKSVTAALLGHKEYLMEKLRKHEIETGTDDGVKSSPYPDGAKTPHGAAQE